ncbi:hypothetical protein CYY_006518 [Polysphondylium violaceum]|uniref:Calcineurin-like phosphoesterase domain-containing protein n=1 Tax=Polysphondylium violaceum TaxID=133409 RepID=A0A8J4PQ82_9MYCE|nr:hypothetical protein CYY_006518 [Polysphondylium violaceum]
MINIKRNRSTLNLVKPYFKRSFSSVPPSSSSSSPKKSSSLKENNNKYWKKLLFTDLHVSSKSLDKTIEVLRSVRELSCTNLLDGKPTPVVFLGDFWHQRNILHVRHIDKLLKEFQQWNLNDIDTIMIPGNHDQVSLDGSIHGIQLFSLFSNIKTTTDPFYDHSEGCAYLPWRETKEEQQQLFNNLIDIYPSSTQSPNDKWTVFAHAEFKGATSNGGYKSNGKFNIDNSSGNISNGSNIRSIYLGHYHKRQQLSNNIWYIGSPYQQNFGEMYDPHGVAFVDSNSITPQFIDFNHLPKHHRLIYPLDFLNSKHLNINSKDIVEIRATKQDMKSDQFVKSLDSLPSFIDIKRTMISSKEEEQEQELKRKENNKSRLLENNNNNNNNNIIKSQFKLEEFLEDYLKNEKSELLDQQEFKKLLYYGKEILSSVKEPSITPLGRKVSVEKISIQDFCGIKGNLDLNLKDGVDIKNKMIMIRGSMGSGKSTLFESLVWCLYGNTSPKKQSSSSSSIKGDEVIHDQAKSTLVTVDLLVDGKPIQITRTKKRGLGAKVNIKGLEEITNVKQGVLDQQNLLNNVIGLDYDLFRMCVYMGQGSISNFVTDTDKRRKELLSRAFSLGLCIPAHKLVKEQRKKYESVLSDINRKISNLDSSLSTWSSIDFIKQSQEWEENKNNRLNILNQDIEKNNQQLEQLYDFDINQELYDQLKEKRDSLNTLKFKLENEKGSKMNQQIQRTVDVSDQISKLKYSILYLENDILKSKKSIDHLSNHSNSKTCFECGQSLISLESIKDRINLETKVLESLELKLQESKELELEFKSKLLKLKDQLKNESDTLENQIKENQLSLNQINQELNIFERDEMKIDFLHHDLAEKKKVIKSIERESNPFTHQIESRLENIRKLEFEKTTLQDQYKEYLVNLENSKFWEQAFSPNGIPMMALNSVVKEVEAFANEFLSILSQGRLFTSLVIEDQDELSIEIFELDIKTKKFNLVPFINYPVAKDVV